MSKSRIIPSPSLLSRRPCASILRPPNLSGRVRATQRLPLTAGPVGLHPNRSHLALAPFALRSFSTSRPRDSTAPPYSYSLSAAFSDKRHKLNLTRNVYSHDTSTKSAGPGRAGRVKSGQDAFFISNIGDSNNLAFGVVDGVGGWEESGVDPAQFAHSLCEYMGDVASAYPQGFEKAAVELRPVDLLDRGYDKVMKDESVDAGGSTACIGTISSTGVLNVANLGDSGYVHLSPFRCNFLSPAQTHRFNTPFQLSKLDKKMLEQVALFGGAKPYSELPSDSALTTRTVQHGDVLIFATDGVWDNLSSEDALRAVTRIMVKLGAWVSPSDGSSTISPDFSNIVNEVTFNMDTQGSANAARGIKGVSAALASALTHEAKVAGLDTKRNGPFAKEVQRLYPQENWTGGKADDICVVVAVVMQDGV